MSAKKPMFVTSTFNLASYPNAKLGRVSVDRMEGIDAEGKQWSWVREVVITESGDERVTDYSWIEVGGNDER